MYWSILIVVCMLHVLVYIDSCLHVACIDLYVLYTNSFHVRVDIQSFRIPIIFYIVFYVFCHFQFFSHSHFVQLVPS